ncbi:MAG: hypothetical protein ACM3PW_06520 [Chlamydiota bacterium]
MSAKLKLAPRKPVDDWKEFRPLEVTRRRQSRSVVPKLLIAIFLFAGFAVMWLLFKPQIGGAVAELGRAISQLGQKQAVSSKPRSATSAVVRKATRVPRTGRGEWVDDAGRPPGPFEVYLLDGDRFIRVDSSSRSVLLNVQTGETTWLDSGAEEGRR